MYCFLKHLPYFIVSECAQNVYNWFRYIRSRCLIFIVRMEIRGTIQWTSQSNQLRFHSQIFLPNWKGSCSVHHCCIQVDLGKVTLSISACLFIFQFDFSDGSIQILLRDNLQQIGSVDLPRSGNLSMNQSSKNFRSSVTICDMSFSSTGNALVTIGIHYFWIY